MQDSENPISQLHVSSFVVCVWMLLKFYCTSLKTHILQIQYKSMLQDVFEVGGCVLLKRFMAVALVKTVSWGKCFMESRISFGQCNKLEGACACGKIPALITVNLTILYRTQ